MSLNDPCLSVFMYQGWWAQPAEFCTSDDMLRPRWALKRSPFLRSEANSSSSYPATSTWEKQIKPPWHLTSKVSGIHSQETIFSRLGFRASPTAGMGRWAFPTSSQMLLLLLLRRPHFENHWSINQLPSFIISTHMAISRHAEIIQNARPPFCGGRLLHSGTASK